MGPGLDKTLHSTEPQASHQHRPPAIGQTDTKLITNKRLGRLKERILRCNITQIVYTPGKKNTTANTFSRRPVVAAMTLALIKAAQKISDDELFDKRDLQNCAFGAPESKFDAKNM